MCWFICASIFLFYLLISLNCLLILIFCLIMGLLIMSLLIELNIWTFRLLSCRMNVLDFSFKEILFAEWCKFLIFRRRRSLFFLSGFFTINIFRLTDLVLYFFILILWFTVLDSWFKILGIQLFLEMFKFHINFLLSHIRTISDTIL